MNSEEFNTSLSEFNTSVPDLAAAFDNLTELNLKKKETATTKDPSSSCSDDDLRSPLRRDISGLTDHTQICTDDEMSSSSLVLGASNSSLQEWGHPGAPPPSNNLPEQPHLQPQHKKEKNEKRESFSMSLDQLEEVEEDNNWQQLVNKMKQARGEQDESTSRVSCSLHHLEEEEEDNHCQQLVNKMKKARGEHDESPRRVSFSLHQEEEEDDHCQQLHNRINQAREEHDGSTSRVSFSSHHLEEDEEDNHCQQLVNKMKKARGEHDESPRRVSFSLHQEDNHCQQLHNRINQAREEHDGSTSRVSFSLHHLEELSLYKLDESSHNHDSTSFNFDQIVEQEGPDKQQTLLGESVFNCSYNTVSNFPADLNEWSLVKILGEGNFGQVWQAERKDLDVEDDRSYALKMLSKYQMVCDGEVDTVIEEKRILQMANQHPFVAKLRAAWQDDNLIYFLQDFLQGGELFSLMLDRTTEYEAGAMPPRKAMAESHVQFYTACIADALQYLHSKRIVYRDLKPENALLDEYGYPVLIDLGAAKVLAKDVDRTYTMTGTPRYVAPELVDGSGHSFGVDHWALAILTYEMLTGDHPFDEWDNSDEVALFECITDCDYKKLPETVSTDVRDWMDQLLVKDPERRLGYIASSDIDPNNSYCVGKSALLKHPWLSKMKMTGLRRRAVKAPWKPSIINNHDSSFFDDWDHLDSVVQNNYPQLTGREAALFDKFDQV